MTQDYTEHTSDLKISVQWKNENLHLDCKKFNSLKGELIFFLRQKFLKMFLGGFLGGFLLYYLFF